MQKRKETIGMSPQNTSDPNQDSVSKKTARSKEPRKPLSSEYNSCQSKKRKHDEEAAACWNSLPPSKKWEDEEDACTTVTDNAPVKREDVSSSSGRERLKRHWTEVAGRVWIPDVWGQEDFLKDWVDCTAFDASLVSSNIMSARASLMDEGRRAANSSRLRVENGC